MRSKETISFDRQFTSIFYFSSSLSHPLPHKTQANSAFHPSGIGKWGPASTGKAKAGMVHSVSGWTRGVQVKLRDPLRTRAIPERLRGVFTTRCYTNPRLSYLYLKTVPSLIIQSTHLVLRCMLGLHQFMISPTHFSMWMTYFLPSHYTDKHRCQTI